MNLAWPFEEEPPCTAWPTPALLFAPPFDAEYPFAAELFTMTEPAPKRFGYLLEFKMFCVFIALE